MKKLLLVSTLTAAVLFTTNVSAEEIVATVGGQGVESTTQSLYKEDKVKTYVQATKYTTAEIEKDIKGASEDSLSLLNNVNNLLIKKKNPVDGKVEAAINGADGAKVDNAGIVSAMTQIRSNVAEAGRLLGLDFAAFSEKDAKALKALDESNKKLKKTLENLTKTIPVGNSNLQLGSVTVPVMGTSRTQVFPIMEGKEMVGSLRVVCGAHLVEDQLINNSAVNYCIGTTWSNSSTRISDAHKKLTTDTYFTAISEPYIPGKVSKVTINWDTQAKVAVKGMLNYYNITDKEVHKTMAFENTVISGNGTKYVGKDAMVMK